MCAHIAPTTPRVAKSVMSVASMTHPHARTITNRAIPLSVDFVQKILSLTHFSFSGRKPRNQKSKRGMKRPTDMDLASFLVGLLQKPTILELPAYTNALPKVTSQNERHLDTRRYGQLLNLVSHKSRLSFGVRIHDATIMRRSSLEEDILGVPRTFMIINYEGIWHTGWRGISWNFRTAERGFRERYELNEDPNHFSYQYFVHPNRRHSIFGAPHLLLKLLWQRIQDELDFYRKELKRLGNYNTNPNSDHFDVLEVGASTSVMVPSFIMSLEGYSYTGEYPSIEASEEGYKKAQTHVDFLQHQLRPHVQFVVRANEAAFYHYGKPQGYVAGWIKDIAWENIGINDSYQQEATFALSDSFFMRYKSDTVSQEVAVSYVK